MLLALDAGNTNITIGAFDNQKLIERWRLRTPGGLVRTEALWDEMLIDRELVRRGGTEYFAFLHPDG